MAEMVTSTQQQTSSTTPWSVQAPYIQTGFEEAQNLYQNPFEFYPGRTVAPFSGATRGALRDIVSQSQNNPYLSGATDYYNQSVGGGFLPTPDNQYSFSGGGVGGPSMSSGNPYLDAMYQAGTAASTRNFMQNVVPGLGSQFGMSGRSGSPGMMNALQAASTGYGEGMGNFAANLYGTAYENERQRQQEMAMFAPNLMEAQRASTAAALEAGQLRDEQRQRLIDARRERFEFGQEEPWKRLERYMGAVGGPYGSEKTATTTTEQPVYSPEWWQTTIGALGAANESGLLGDVYEQIKKFVIGG